MSYREFTGKTVREAIRRAADELQVEESLLEVKVIEESSRGFLGIVGQKDARIKVRKRDILKEVMQMGEEGVSSADSAPVSSHDEEPPAKPEPQLSDGPAEHAEAESAPEEAPSEQPADGREQSTQRAEAEAEEKTPDRENRPRTGRGPGRSQGGRRRKSAEAASAEPAPQEPRPAEEETVVEPEHGSPLWHAKSALEEMLKRMPIETRVRAGMVNGTIELEIEGDGSGLLIGKKGQTLDAFQFLVNKIVNKDNPPGEKVEVIVDTENYRLRKRENLRDKAAKLCAKAKRTQKPVWFDPMPASERRIVHMILSEDREVYTKSHGEGPVRRIVVYPRRGPVNKRRGR